MRLPLCAFVSLIAIVSLSVSAHWTPTGDNNADNKKTAELILRLDAKTDRERESAAEAMGELDDARVVPALRDHVKQESDFHVRLAIHFALASQGEKSSVRELIASLRQTGHLGAVYLGRLSGKDYGWDSASWESWNRETSAEVFKKRAKEWIRQRPMREEFQKFRSLYMANHFERFELDLSKRLGADERKQLTELPTAKAWASFTLAINELQENGNRAAAAKLFREAATKYGETYYSTNARELADLLDKMVAEDRAWKEPKDVSTLSKSELIAYHIYHLRDVVAHQWMQPGYCNVVSGFSLLDETNKAAKELCGLGKAAIPALMELLDDRRPIRAVGYWRDFHPTCTVLRYQDAAIQILNELLPEPPYVGRTTSSYLSNEDPDDRAKLIKQVRKSQQCDKEGAHTDVKATTQQN